MKSPIRMFKMLNQLRSPGMMESLEKIKEIATNIEEIEDSLRDPAMLKNIENMNLSSEAIQKIAVKIRTIRSELETTGIIEEAKFISALSIKFEYLRELVTCFKATARSGRGLMDELKLVSHKSVSS